MEISITDAVLQTQVFILILILALLITVKKRPSFKFDNSLTEELKGGAMLAIVLAHIGYFLAADHRFLFPISVGAGFGVNLFLLLSGYGLTISAINKQLSIKEFYLKRLLKLLIPLWIILICFIGIDWLLLQKTYSISYISQSLAGIYLSSNPTTDIDSPLWYFSLILFFYLIFPLVFRKTRPLLSGILILAITWVFLHIPLPLQADNIHLYQLHFLAFPLGIILASIKNKIQPIFGRFKLLNNVFLKYGLLIVLGWLFGYFALYSGVGEGAFKEQAISIINIFILLTFFLIKNFQFRLLNIFGKYSYEIYLLHWPIMFRYQNLFQYMPASLAVVCYLAELVLLGFFLQKLVQKITSYDGRKS